MSRIAWSPTRPRRQRWISIIPYPLALIAWAVRSLWAATRSSARCPGLNRPIPDRPCRGPGDVDRASRRGLAFRLPPHLVPGSFPHSSHFSAHAQGEKQRVAPGLACARPGRHLIDGPWSGPLHYDRGRSPALLAPAAYLGLSARDTAFSSCLVADRACRQEPRWPDIQTSPIVAHPN
jgi:hypothetical protein